MGEGVQGRGTQTRGGGGGGEEEGSCRCVEGCLLAGERGPRNCQVVWLLWMNGAATAADSSDTNTCPAAGAASIHLLLSIITLNPAVYIHTCFNTTSPVPTGSSRQGGGSSIIQTDGMRPPPPPSSPVQ
jgi:hypothetical protein